MAKWSLARKVKNAIQRLSNRVAKFEQAGFKLPQYVYRMLAGDSVSTKRLNTIQSYDNKKLQSIAKYKTDEGEVITYEDLQHKKRSEASKKGWATRRRRELEESSEAIVQRISGDISIINLRMTHRNSAGLKHDIAMYLHKLLNDAYKTAKREGELDNLYESLQQTYSQLQYELEAIAGYYVISKGNAEAVAGHVGRAISIIGKSLGIDEDLAYDIAESMVL